MVVVPASRRSITATGMDTFTESVAGSDGSPRERSWTGRTSVTFEATMSLAESPLAFVPRKRPRSRAVGAGWCRFRGTSRRRHGVPSILAGFRVETLGRSRMVRLHESAENGPAGDKGFAKTPTRVQYSLWDVGIDPCSLSYVPPAMGNDPSSNGSRNAEWRAENEMRRIVATRGNALGCISSARRGRMPLSWKSCNCHSYPLAAPREAMTA